MFPELLFGDFFPESIVQECLRPRVQNVPHLGFSVLMLGLQGVGIVGMHLDGKVVLCVDKLDQDGKFTENLAVAAQHAKTVGSDIVLQRPPGKGAVGNDAGSVRMAG